MCVWCPAEVRIPKNVSVLRVGDSFVVIQGEGDSFQMINAVVRPQILDVVTAVLQFHPGFMYTGYELRIESPLDHIPQVDRCQPLLDAVTQYLVVFIQGMDNLGMDLQELSALPVVPLVLAPVTAKFLVNPSILDRISALQAFLTFPVLHDRNHIPPIFLRPQWTSR